jgi:hypothetical protein
MADGGVREPATFGWDWEAHERAQRRRYANLPLAAKIAWLEEAQQMVLLMEQHRSRVRDRTTEVDLQD